MDIVLRTLYENLGMILCKMHGNNECSDNLQLSINNIYMLIDARKNEIKMYNKRIEISSKWYNGLTLRQHMIIISEYDKPISDIDIRDPNGLDADDIVQLYHYFVYESKTILDW